MSHPAFEVKILLADDDKDDCEFFSDALQELPAASHLTCVHDGEQLLQLLHKTIDLPHVLFLDLNMPRKNGFECLRVIKSNPVFNSLPVIIVSTSFDRKVADRLYEGGARHYICKPSDFLLLKEVIQQALLLITTGNSLQPSRDKFLLGNLQSIIF